MKYDVYIMTLEWNNFNQGEIIKVGWTYFFFNFL